MHFEEFVSSLSVMGKGMLGIFIVVALIIGVMALLNQFTKEKQ